MAINPYEDELEQLTAEPPDLAPRVQPPPRAARATFAEDVRASIEEDQQAEATRIRLAQKQAAPIAPDRAAKARTLADELGISPAFAERNLEALEARRRVTGLEVPAIQRQSPALAEWLHNPSNAAIAADDLEPLGALEWLVTAPQRAWQRGVHQVNVSQLRSASLFRELTRSEQDRLAEEKFHMEQGGALGAGDSWFRGAVVQSMTTLPSLFGATLQGVKRGLPAATTAGAAAMLYGQLGPQIGTPEELFTVPAATLAGGRAGLYAGAAEFGFYLEAGLAYDEFLTFRDEAGQPLDPAVAKAAALAAGGMNAGLEAVGLGILLRAMPGVSALGRVGRREAIKVALRSPTVRGALLKAAGTYASTIAQESAVEVAQRAVTILAGELGKATGETVPPAGLREPGTINLYEQPTIANPDGSVGPLQSVPVSVDGREVLLPTVTAEGAPLTGIEEQLTAYRETGRHFGIFETPAQAVAYGAQLREAYAAGAFAGEAYQKGPETIGRELGEEWVGAMQAFAVIGLPGPTMSAAGNIGKAREAQQNVAFYQALADGVKASKTVARQPAAAQEFLARATKDGPVETLYAPVDTFTTYWQSKGIDPAEMADALTGQRGALEAATRTGEDLAIPTAAYAVKIAGTEHHAYFQNEIKLQPWQMNAREGAAFIEQFGQAQQARTAGLEGLEPEAPDVGRDAVIAQLTARGIPQEDAATYAKLLDTAAFGQLVKRAGLDPVAWFERYGLRIRRAGMDFPIGQEDRVDDRGTEAGGAPAGPGGVPADVRIEPSTPPAAAFVRTGVDAAGKTKGYVKRESPAQQRARRAAHYAELTAAVTAAAQAVDPTVDVATVAAELAERLELLEELDAEWSESGRNPRRILEAIAKAGGISIEGEGEGGQAGELRWIRESPALGPFGSFGGVKGVFRARSTGGAIGRTGLSLDDMAGILRGSGEFPDIRTLDDLREVLEQVARDVELDDTGGTFPGTQDLARRAGIHLDRAWWTPAAPAAEAGELEGAELEGDDVSFDPTQFDQSGALLTDTPAFRAWFRESKVETRAGEPLVVYHNGEFDPELHGAFNTRREGAHFGTHDAATDRSGGRMLDAALESVTAVFDEEQGLWFWESDVYGEQSLDEEGSMSASDAVEVGQREVRQAINDGNFDLSSEAEQVTDVYLSIQNPLRVPDLGRWPFRSVLDVVKTRAGFTADEVAALEAADEAAAEARVGFEFLGIDAASADAEIPWELLKRTLEAHGVDGLVYRNAVEDKGKDSWIAFRPEQIKHATRNVGTFDRQDPNVLHQPQLELFRSMARLPRATLAELEARGFDTSRVYYHQTAAVNRPAITEEGFDLTKGRARLSDEQVPDGVFLKPDARDIGVGAEGALATQIPLYVRFGETRTFQTRAELEAFVRGLDPTYGELVLEAREYDRAQSVEFDRRWAAMRALDVAGGDHAANKLDVGLDEFMAEWKAGNVERATAARALATTALREAGVETVVIKQDAGSFGRATETVIALAGDQLALAEKGQERILFQEQIDLLDTGEEQPRLPGAEAVRDQEIATPELEAPFALTPTVAKPSTKGAQRTLFQGPADRGTGVPLAQAATIPSDSAGHPVVQNPSALPNFRRWFGASVVVDDQGRPLVVYHGALRSDRVGPVLRKGRATSGPMIMFTDDPAIASSYAAGKADTSLPDEAREYAAWFRIKVKGGRAAVNLDRAWWFLSPAERDRIAALAPRVAREDSFDQPLELQPEGHTRGPGPYDQNIKEARGNHLQALIETWLMSGMLFNDERQFLEVLKLAGLEAEVEFHDPNAQYPGVLPVYLAITNPLDTAAIPPAVVEALERRSRRQRRPRWQIGADLWDKRTRDAREWMAELREDLANDKNSYAWTSIPDWVTKELRALGYDGVRDRGGKGGGDGHTVWIPFEPGQVKSAIGNRGTFDPTSPNILYQSAWHGSAALFERFDLTKIGTGEGAAAYGWGLYFATKKAIADWYRNNLVRDKSARFTALTDEENHTLPAWVRDRIEQPEIGRDDRPLTKPAALEKMVADFTGRIAEARAELEPATEEQLAADLAAGWGTLRATPHPQPWMVVENIKGLEEILRILEKLKAADDYTTKRERGRLYKVELPDPETFLDWDLPISEQPPAVREALGREGIPVAKHTAAARANFLADVQAAVEAAGGSEARVDEALAHAEKLLTDDSPQARQTSAAAGLRVRLRELVGRRVDLNRIGEITDRGIDQAFIDRRVEELFEAEVDRRVARVEDRGDLFDNGPSFRADARINTEDYEGDAWEAYVGDEPTGDAYDTEQEALEAAQEAADAERDIFEERVQRELRTDISNAIDRAPFERQVAEELELDEEGRAPVLTGGDAYEQLADRFGPEGASRMLATAGVPGIQYLDASSRGGHGDTQNFVIFDDRLIEIVDYEQSKRGRITIGGNRQMTIDLLENADASTFIHEVGHFYLEVMGDLSDHLAALDPETLDPQQRRLMADYAALLAFAGVEGRANLGREQHEQIARAFEAYLMEGKAPSVELRGAFARMRAWLLSVYRLLRLNATLTDDVRGVFDRMLASDEAIAAVEAEGHVAPLFAVPPPGMSPAQFDAYQAQVAAAGTSARETLDRQLLEEWQRTTTAWWKDRRAATEVVVRRRVEALPVYQAMAAIRAGTTPDGTPLLEGQEPQPQKLSKAAIVALKGPAYPKTLPRPYLYTTKADGVHPDVVAEQYGFSSGDELLNALMNAPELEAVVAEQTDARMREQYGDLLTNEPAKAAAAEAAVYQARFEVVETELAALHAATLTRVAMPPRALLEQAATTRIARTRIRDLKPGVFLVSAQRASARAFTLVATDPHGAAQAKQQELLNLALYKAARDAQQLAERQHTALLRFNTKSVRQAMGRAGAANYLEPIDSLLEQYELATRTNRTLDRRTSLREFVAARERQNLPIDIPADVLDAAQQVNWRELPTELFAGVHDTVQQIAHLARFKNRLHDQAEKRTLNALADDLAASIAEFAPGKHAIPLETRLPQDAAAQSTAGFFAWQRKLSSLIRQMDGGRDNGPMWSAVMRRINASADDEAVRQEHATIGYVTLLKTFTSADLAGMYRKQQIPAIGASLTRAGRIMVALNWGNEGNRERILAGFGWNESQVQAVLDTLTERDWTFIKGAWAAIDQYWTDIAAKQERVYGIAPAKVEATPFLTKFGMMPGGYLPIKGDQSADPQAYAHAVEQAATDMIRGAKTIATTRRGHTKERVGGKGKVLLDLSVIWQHSQTVIHDLTHHEMLIDVNRILGHKKVQGAILEHYGPAVHKEMLAVMRDIAAGDIPVQQFGERALEWLRQGTSIAYMAFNTMTGMVQPLGLTVSIKRIGPVAVGRGLARWIGSAPRMEGSVAWIHGRSSFMRLRHKTLMREVSEIRMAITPRGSLVGASMGQFVAGDAGAAAAFRAAEWYGRVEDAQFWLISRAQMIADIPTWLGAYERAMTSGVDEATAIALADQAVIDTQGSGHIKDLSSAQRGGPALKLFTQFMSYFSVLYQQGAESRADYRRSTSPTRIVKLGADLLLLYTVPMILEMAVRDAIRGEDDDDEALMLTLAKNQLAYLLNTVVLARELSGPVLGYDYRGPAGAGFFGAAGLLAKQVTQGEADRALWSAFLQTTGILFHFPAIQVQRTLDAFLAAQDGEPEAAVRTAVAGKR